MKRGNKFASLKKGDFGSGWSPTRALSRLDFARERDRTRTYTRRDAVAPNLASLCTHARHPDDTKKRVLPFSTLPLHLLVPPVLFFLLLPSLAPACTFVCLNWVAFYARASSVNRILNYYSDCVSLPHRYLRSLLIFESQR